MALGRQFPDLSQHSENVIPLQQCDAVVSMLGAKPLDDATAGLLSLRCRLWSAPSSLCVERPESRASPFSVGFGTSCEYRGHITA
jgi:hypothetical protein